MTEPYALAIGDAQITTRALSLYPAPRGSEGRSTSAINGIHLTRRSRGQMMQGARSAAKCEPSVSR